VKLEDYPPVMNTSQAAEMLGLSVSHLRHLVRTGRIPARRIAGGRSLRFFRDELIEWLKSQPSGAIEREASDAGR
jgi:excisionase family DNA binding protein